MAARVQSLGNMKSGLLRLRREHDNGILNGADTAQLKCTGHLGGKVTVSVREI